MRWRLDRFRLTYTGEPTDRPSSAVDGRSVPNEYTPRRLLQHRLQTYAFVISDSVNTAAINDPVYCCRSPTSERRPLSARAVPRTSRTARMFDRTLLKTCLRRGKRISIASGQVDERRVRQPSCRGAVCRSVGRESGLSGRWRGVQLDVDVCGYSWRSCSPLGEEEDVSRLEVGVCRSSCISAHRTYNTDCCNSCRW